MRQYIARRLLLFIPTMLGATLIIFVLMRVIPGDAAITILAGTGGTGIIDPQDLAALRHELGLDQPIFIQYFDWLWHIIRLDFGKSIWTGVSVAEELRTRFPLTLEQAFIALSFTLLLAVPIGMYSALRQDSWPDYTLRVITIAGLCMPIFWTGILIIFFLVLFFDWMPPLGYASLLDDPLKNLQQLIFPALAQGYFISAVIARMTRSCMLEVLRQDYIRTAWAKGLRERAIVVRHALKNAVLPVVTIAGWQFGVLLGGTIIMEQIFSLPGMGRNLIESIYHRDYPMIQAIVLFMATIFLVINLCIDILYGWLDPRIRYQ